MNSPQSVPASNDDDYRAPEKALAVYRAYQQARQKDPLSIHIMWKDEFLALLRLAADEELAANAPLIF